jgi:hypothetical protein
VCVLAQGQKTKSYTIEDEHITAYLCVYVYIYIYIYIYTGHSIHIHTYTHIHIYAGHSMHIHTHMHVRACTGGDEKELWPVDIRLVSQHSLLHHHVYYSSLISMDQTTCGSFAHAVEEMRDLCVTRLHIIATNPGAVHHFVVKNVKFLDLAAMLPVNLCKAADATHEEGHTGLINYSFDHVKGKHIVAGCADVFAKVFGDLKLATDGYTLPDSSVIKVMPYRPNVSSTGIIFTYDAFFAPGEQSFRTVSCMHMF